MPKLAIEIEPRQVESLVDQLPLPVKVRLVEKLEAATWAARWDALTTRLRRQTKAKGLSERTIRRLCEEVRQELHGRTQGCV